MTTFNDTSPDEDALEHFGTKGMRWGHRKARDSSNPTSHRNSGKRSNTPHTIKPNVSSKKSGLSGKQKAALFAAGAIATTIVVKKYGKTNISDTGLDLSAGRALVRASQNGSSSSARSIPKAAPIASPRPTPRNQSSTQDQQERMQALIEEQQRRARQIQSQSQQDQAFNNDILANTFALMQQTRL